MSSEDKWSAIVGPKHTDAQSSLLEDVGTLVRSIGFDTGIDFLNYDLLSCAVIILDNLHEGEELIRVKSGRKQKFSVPIPPDLRDVIIRGMQGNGGGGGPLILPGQQVQVPVSLDVALPIGSSFVEVLDSNINLPDPDVLSDLILLNYLSVPTFALGVASPRLSSKYVKCVDCYCTSYKDLEDCLKQFYPVAGYKSDVWQATIDALRKTHPVK
jgi:hypothetical protein